MSTYHNKINPGTEPLQKETSGPHRKKRGALSDTGMISTKMTADTKYMDIMNGILLFGREKFSETAKPIRTGMVLTSEDMAAEEKALSPATPYACQINDGLNQDRNAVSLVPGVHIVLDSGFMLDITANGIDQTGDFRRTMDSREAGEISEALNAVIKMANGQIEGYEFYNHGEKNTKLALMGLKAAGIDTEKEMYINEVRFIVEDGILQKV